MSDNGPPYATHEFMHFGEIEIERDRERDYICPSRLVQMYLVQTVHVFNGT